MGRRFVSFALGSGKYCVPVEDVTQIVRHESILRIPKAPPFVEGVINIRGDIVPVINVRVRLGLAACEDMRKARIIVTRRGERLYGLLVDEVREIVDLEEKSITRDIAADLGTGAEFVWGIAEREKSLLVIVDLPSLLSPEREAQAGDQAVR